MSEPKLFFCKRGNGTKRLLLFHGFGQDHNAFNVITSHLSDVYTTYSFDLYFHGQSEWLAEDPPLNKQEWKTQLQTFLASNQIDNFDLLGYSLGAKFVLSTLEAFPEKTKSVFLIAPDGIMSNFWYRFATSSPVTRSIFKSMIVHPERFKKVVGLLQSLRLIEKNVLRFAESQMNTYEKRKRVYYSWVVFRKLTAEPKKIASCLNTFRIPLLVFVGKYDKIIRPRHINRLLHHVDQCQVEVLNAGHNHLLEDATAQHILKVASREQK